MVIVPQPDYSGKHSQLPGTAAIVMESSSRDQGVGDSNMGSNDYQDGDGQDHLVYMDRDEINASINQYIANQAGFTSVYPHHSNSPKSRIIQGSGSHDEPPIYPNKSMHETGNKKGVNVRKSSKYRNNFTGNDLNSMQIVGFRNLSSNSPQSLATRQSAKVTSMFLSKDSTPPHGQSRLQKSSYSRKDPSQNRFASRSSAVEQIVKGSLNSFK